MSNQISEGSPAPHARITGVVYLLYFLTAIFAVFLNSHQFVVYGYVFNVIATTLYVAVTLFFYYLFKPVNSYLSMLAALLSLSGCAFTAFGLFHMDRLNVINPLAFFGPYCILLDFLILKSTFLFKFLGVLMVLAGIGWLTYLSPLGNFLSLYIKILGILAEASLMLWLIVKAVDIQQWKEQAAITKNRNMKDLQLSKLFPFF